MDIPRTVTAALADRPVDHSVCLEAGAGVGNTTAGLLAGGADRVYAVTNDASHAATVRDRFARPDSDRLAVLHADVRWLPLATDSVGLVTAHGLFNLLAPRALDRVADELTRVAAPGCHLVVDDYEPLPEDAAVSDLFALENAAAELVTGTPALSFYPEGVLRRLFVGDGWQFDRRRTLLDPVPWTASHLEAHADEIRTLTAKLPADLRAPLDAEAGRLVEEVESESVGEMYSLALRFPG
jgi:SAM-dependent methyltransferase